MASGAEKPVSASILGEADNAHRILQGFSPSQRLEIHVVHIVDLEHLGTEARRRHPPSQRRPGDSTFARIELDKVRRAVEACEVD